MATTWHIVTPAQIPYTQACDFSEDIEAAAHLIVELRHHVINKQHKTESALSSTRKIAIYHYIKDYFEEYKTQPYQIQIAQTLHVSKRVVVKVIREFEELGIIQQLGGKSRIRKFCLSPKPQYEVLALILSKG